MSPSPDPPQSPEDSPEDRPEGAPPPNLATLRARLEASRAALVGSIARLTEQDFAAELEPGLSVAGLLASLAAGERDAAAAARDPADATRATRATSSTSSTGGTVLAPQAIHDLAGARFETLRALDAVASGELPDAAIAALAPVAEREEAAAERLRGKVQGE